MSGLLQFMLTALAYGLSAVVLVGMLERIGALRDGAVAETVWRIALYGGLCVATIQSLALWFEVALADRPAMVVAEASPRIDPKSDSPKHLDAQPTAAALKQAVPAQVRRPSRWVWSARAAQAVMLLAMLSSMIALVGVARTWWRGRRFIVQALRRAQPVSEHWAAHVRAVQAESLQPQLRSVSDLDSPVCGGSHTILLPTWADTLDAASQRALLAHELAHLRRRDPQWRIADAIVVALMGGLPPFRNAARRLEALAEFACDADAARRTQAPRALAECIAQCLEHQYAALPRLTVAMAVPESPVVERVQRLIEERPMFTSERPILRRSLIALAIVGALSLPVMAIHVAANGPGASIQVESSDNVVFGKTLQASFNEAGRHLTLRTRGTVRFSDLEDDIASISDGGSFEVADDRGDVEHSLSIESNNGQITRVYHVDGAVQPFDATARQWLAQTLPDVFRRTGLDAEARAKRIHARAGLDGLIKEAALVTSDDGRAAYIAAVFELDRPNANQIEQSIGLVRDMQSDYTQRQALTMILAQPQLEDGARLAVLHAATAIDSDYERAELLIEAGRHPGLEGAHLKAWQDAVAAIGSDYEMRRVLTSVFEQRDVRPERAHAVLAMAEGIGSDYEKRMVLEAAVDAGLGPTITRSAYTRVAATIGSDYDRREALLKLIEDGEVDGTLALDVLNAAREIGSDYETKEVLIALARVMPADARVIEVYRSVARDLSTYERGEAEQALDRFAGV